MRNDRQLPPGLYEQLVTDALRRRLPDERVDIEPLRDDASSLLADHIARSLLRSLRAPGRTIADRVQLCNQLLTQMIGYGPAGAVDQGDLIPSPGEILTAIQPPPSDLGSMRYQPPETPLSADALFINAPHEPGLAAQLRIEISSADGIDLLCAFVRWSGIRVLLEELQRARDRGVPVRIITTTYTGSTEARALEELAEIGAEIKVSYDTRMTRLHAKAWLFERASGFSTAYIGSSNVTHAALHEGLEWNVRLSQVRSGDLLDRFRGAFETYWADEHFAPYQRDEFEAALASRVEDYSLDYTPFTIVPFPFQQAMLERLRAERERHGHWRNLVVAATGTGKTVVAALDYKRLAQDWGRPSLLFVAHRHEILDQSRGLFRHVLRDGAFGEMLVAGSRPQEGRHVFASIQSLAGIGVHAIAPDAYDVVIVDEFHHAEAPTYRRLLEHLRPRVLLGLTATPERADTKDILQWFDGRIAVELRLWDALDQGLLCPFQYFGVADDVDLRGLEWKRSGYDLQALSGLYTANNLRTGKILRAVRDIVTSPVRMRALGFCVSVEHAVYMAEAFSRAGIPARAVTGNVAPRDRHEAIRQLTAREINVIFTVDVFNEGVDIPEVDTILLLRPTESATIFLQQLGRGLRLSEGKDGLTVLDFIGQQRREFRFDARFQALTGVPALRLVSALDEGFPYLPAGCTIQLDRVAGEIVRENLKSAVSNRRDMLVRELRGLGDISLAGFLSQTGRQLRELYRGNRPGWAELRRDAGLWTPPRVEGDEALVRAIGRMTHIDDEERLAAYERWIREDSPPQVEYLPPREIRLLNMLHVDLRGGQAGSASLRDSLESLWEHETARYELAEVMAALASIAETLPVPNMTSVEPLAVHAHYTRAEVVAALGVSTPERPRPFREGVLWAAEAEADVLLVTLRKSEKHFSPTTMYRDYAISPTRFHWESQSTTSVVSPTGQRYIHHADRGTRVLLFAREDRDRTFLYLGPATYERHSGDRPIEIVWQLDYEIPAEFFLEARAAG